MILMGPKPYSNYEGPYVALLIRGSSIGFAESLDTADTFVKLWVLIMTRDPIS